MSFCTTAVNNRLVQALAAKPSPHTLLPFLLFFCLFHFASLLSVAPCSATHSSCMFYVTDTSRYTECMIFFSPGEKTSHLCVFTPVWTCSSCFFWHLLKLQSNICILAFNKKWRFHSSWLACLVLMNISGPLKVFIKYSVSECSLPVCHPLTSLGWQTRGKTFLFPLPLFFSYLFSCFFLLYTVCNIQYARAFTCKTHQNLVNTSP